MAFDGIVISNIVSELKQKLTGGRISKIAQPEPEELVLTIKNKKDTYRLFLSANASLPLIYLTQEAGLSPMTAPNFCMLLRKHIGNARITDVTQPGLERIVRLELEHLDELGDLRQKSLVIEIMGKHSNIIFCDGTKIVDSIKHVSAAVSSVREVLPGRDYFIPNTTGKTNPLAADKTFFSSLFSSGKNIAAILSGNFTGISNVSAEEIVYRSGLDSSLAAEACTLEEQTRLWNTFSGVMDLIRTQQFSPCIAYDNNEPKEFSAFLLTGLTEYRLQTFDSISEVLYTYYNSRSAIARMRQKSADLRHLVQNLIERTAKKADLQRRQLSDTDKREKYRIYGELLNAYGYDCPPDAKSYEVFNYYTDQMMTIPLDPTMTAKENAQKYFERYNKLKRTFEALSTLTVETENELAHLESIMASIDIAASDIDLDEIRRELGESGYIKSHGPKGRKDNRRKCVPYHYLSSDGFDIYVGKNNYQNEELTFKFAQGNDIWMHAKKTPGSHVIIQTNGREVPDRTYEEAGSLAVYYSKAKTAPKAEVDYIERKFVKKPAGAKPGFVIYHTNYSLVASPDISSLKLISGGE